MSGQDSKGDGARGAALACGALLCVFAAVLFLPSLKGGFVYTDIVRLFGVEQKAADARDAAADPYAETAPGEKFLDARAPRMSAVHAPVFTGLLHAAVPAFKFHERPYHALSLALHLACALLVYALILSCAGRARRARVWMGAVSAACGAALFAAHPGAAVSEAWLWAMPQLLAGSLLLGSTLLFVRSARGGRGAGAAYAASVILYALGVFAHTGALLWFLVPVAAVLPAAQSRGRILLRAVPFVLASAAAAAVYYSWGAFGAGYGAGAYFERAGAYLRALAVVWRMPPVHPAPVSGAAPGLLIGGAAGLAVLAVLAAWGAWRRWNPALCAGLAAIFAAAASHAFTAHPFLSDSGPYLAYAGLGMTAAVAGAAAAAPDPRRLSRISAAPMALAAILVLAAACVAARENIFAFRNNATFWSRMADDTGRDPLVLYYYALAQHRQGNYASAVLILTEAHEKAEGDPALQRTLANQAFVIALDLYDKKPQHYAFAKQHLIRSIDMDPMNPYSYAALARIYLDRQQRYYSAYVNMLIARELAPDREAMERGLVEVLEQALQSGKPLDRKEGRKAAETWLRDIGALEKDEPLPPDPSVPGARKPPGAKKKSDAE